MILGKLTGGLGNQLFVISATSSLSNDDESYFDIDHAIRPQQGITSLKYKDNILRNVNFCKVDYKKQYNEPKFNYTKIPYEKNMELVGYYQSEKYFKHNKDFILGLFEPTIDIKEKLFDFISSTNKTNKTTISLHIRRGDYISIPKILPSVTIDYINKSMSLFENSFIYVFSDDIEWCKSNIININNNELFYR